MKLKQYLLITIYSNNLVKKNKKKVKYLKNECYYSIFFNTLNAL
jgi:hypothetical protein